MGRKGDGMLPSWITVGGETLFKLSSHRSKKNADKEKRIRMRDSYKVRIRTGKTFDGDPNWGVYGYSKKPPPWERKKKRKPTKKRKRK